MANWFGAVPGRMAKDERMDLYDLGVLYALAVEANQNGVSKVPLARIAQYGKMSKATACRRLQKLEDAGYIARKQRIGCRGFEVTEYLIIGSVFGDLGDNEMSPDTETRVSPNAETGLSPNRETTIDTPPLFTTSLSPLKDSLEVPRETPLGRAEEVLPKPVLGYFRELWARFPNKAGKGKAAKAYSRIRPQVTLSLHVEMLRAVDEQKAGEQWRKDGGRFVPHLATWLNNSGWEDPTPVDPDADEKRKIDEEYRAIWAEAD